MSSKSSLLVFLLCISFHASNARRLGEISPKMPAKKSLVSNKNEEKGSHVEIPVSTKLRPSLPEQTRVDDKNHDRKPMSPEAKEMKKHKGVREISSPPQPAQSPLSEYTWQLPHGIPPGQNRPGFNLDYAPPETHPPVSN
ncbi:hypothetical protein RHSIM_Rhsim01G0150200 [Rhododendron simsii]|uniref:Uncharacterized protein n=1 Tax=Rhododendron simsii TaxID=118357 RepID=A0A834HH41_RHOSS|nr:hypothetical protein RHSIM_Rhsim01G0150200 [Rhododendron simsii]